VPSRGQHVTRVCDRPASVPLPHSPKKCCVTSVAHDRRIARVDFAIFFVPLPKTDPGMN